jgi:MFS family permease
VTAGHHRRLPATVVALGLASLLTDLSSEMIYPLLPVFLSDVLGAGAIALGVVEGIAESTAAFVKVASGRVADRVGRRKPLVVAGYAISGAARPLIGLASAWSAVVALRFADRVGKGVRTSPRDALIADVTPPSRRGAAFGLHRAMDHAGAVAGPLVAAGLLLALPIRTVFLLAAIPAVLVIAVLAAWVHDPGTGLDGEHSGVGRAPLDPGLRRLLIAVGVFALGNSADAFLLLRFNDLGMGAVAISLLWAALHAVKMAATWIGGRLSDRVGRKPMVLAGWGVYAAVYAAFATVSGTGVLVAVFLAYGVYFGLTEPVERSWVAAMAAPTARGTAFGAYHGVIGIAALPASLVFGAVYRVAGPPAAFALGAGLAAAAAVLLVGIPERPSR